MKKRQAKIGEEVFVYTLTAAMMAGHGRRSIKPYEKPKRKCLLPGCDVMTDHNGGYCCAEHCKQHREEMRNKDITPSIKRKLGIG